MALRFKKLNSNAYATVKRPETLRVKWNGPCRSNFQKTVKQFLEPYWSRHQVFEEMPVPGTPLRCDLVNLSRKIVVESNGMQHDKYNKFFHRGNVDAWLDQINRDNQKRLWAQQNGFQFIEIYEADLPLTVEFFKTKFDIDL